MEIKDFIGKPVIIKETGKRCILYEITSPLIEAADPETLGSGILKVFRYHTINGNPFINGDLAFEDESLLKPFLAVYDTHCRSEDGRMEEYGYWMRRA